jgi:hypothetical protein
MEEVKESDSFIIPSLTFTIFIYLCWLFFLYFPYINLIFLQIPFLATENPLSLYTYELVAVFWMCLISIMFPLTIILIFYPIWKNLRQRYSKERKKYKGETFVKNIVIIFGLALGIFLAMQLFLYLSPFQPDPYIGLQASMIFLLLLINLVIITLAFMFISLVPALLLYIVVASFYYLRSLV